MGCKKLVAAKIPFAGGGAGFLTTAGGAFFSGTGFLGGTVTKGRRVYALEAAKRTEERQPNQPSPEDRPGEGRSRHSSRLAKYLLEWELVLALPQPPLEALLGQSPLQVPHTL